MNRNLLALTTGAAIATLGACAVVAPAQAALPRTLATYDAAKSDVAVAGGYGWTAWTVYSTRSRSTKVVTIHDGRRHSFVPSGGRVQGSPAIVRADEKGGIPRVYLVASICSGSMANQQCGVAAYRIDSGRRVHPGWLSVVYGAGTGADALDRGRSVRITGVTIPTPGSAPSPADQICTATIGAPNSINRVALPPVPDCTDPSGTSMRGRFTEFTATRPSGSSDQSGISDVYVADTDRPAAGWVRIGSTAGNDAGFSGAVGSVITDDGPVVAAGSVAFTPGVTGVASPTLTRWNLTGLGTAAGAVASPSIAGPAGFVSIASPGPSLVTVTSDATGTGKHRHGTTVVRELPLPS